VIRFPGNGADVWILKSHISRVECERSAFGRTEPLVIDQQGANGLRTALPVLLHIPSYDTLGVSFRTSTTPRTSRTHQTGEPSYSLLDELPRDRRSLFLTLRWACVPSGSILWIPDNPDGPINSAATVSDHSEAGRPQRPAGGNTGVKLESTYCESVVVNPGFAVL